MIQMKETLDAYDLSAIADFVLADAKHGAVGTSSKRHQPSTSFNTAVIRA
jgi:hypothetical protein